MGLMSDFLLLFFSFNDRKSLMRTESYRQAYEKERPGGNYDSIILFMVLSFSSFIFPPRRI